jgi:hypothetical protein
MRRHLTAFPFHLPPQPPGFPAPNRVRFGLNDHIEYGAPHVKGESKEAKIDRQFLEGDQVLLDNDGSHFLIYLLTVRLICEKYLNPKGGGGISGKVIHVSLEIIN